jgi:MOSC domain-containing protein YiiM
MQIISTNIAKPTAFKWNEKEVITGIFKKPVSEPLYLEKEAVKGDEVSDRKVHGGIYKACYLFSADHYPYWKNLYPNLEWDYGMFGENLTVSGLDETQIHIGDIYKIGTALVQVTQPREPCFKFGVKFGNQEVLKQFIKHGRPGTYLSILEEGSVNVGDDIILVERSKSSLTIVQLFNLYYAKDKDQKILKLAIDNEALPMRKRTKLTAYVKQ